MAQEHGTPFRASDEDWSWIEARCILELRARVEALEAAAGTTQHQPKSPTAAPTLGVTVEELQDILASTSRLFSEELSVYLFASGLAAARAEFARQQGDV